MTYRTIKELGPDTKTPVNLEKGDICIAATYREGEVNIRRNVGAGRVVVLDKDLQPKGALWTQEQGLIVGLAYDKRSHTLFVSDVTSQTVKRFSASGEMLESFVDMQGKPFGPIAITPEGSIVIGEHIKGDKFPFIGGGAIYRFNRDGDEIACHKAEHDPGKFGFHGVTNFVLSDEGKRAIYISETGKRVMQYDLASDKQLDDLFVLDDEGEMVTAGIGLCPNGELLLAHVYGVSLMSSTGEILNTYDIEHDKGWAAIKPLADGKTFLASNFFSGRLEKRDLQTGKLLASLETEMPLTLASIEEIT